MIEHILIFVKYNNDSNIDFIEFFWTKVLNINKSKTLRNHKSASVLSKGFPTEPRAWLECRDLGDLNGTNNTDKDY
jgi:hypothetical protein